MLTLTYTNKRTQKGFKINLNRLFTSLLTVIVIISCIGLYVDLCRFPEKYCTTYKYQLKNDIKRGDAEAIEYYNRVYTANGINLFGD